MNYTDLIYENYDKYMVEHRSDMDTPSGAIEMLTSDGSFRSYIDSICEGLDPHQKANVMAVCERERECLLEESAQLGPSSSIIGYAVN
jgi:hypothetical protein